MGRKRHSAEQIISNLRRVDEGLSQGKTIADMAREFGVSETTIHRWRNKFGGMSQPDAKRLRELEKKNMRLKRMVADQALDIEMLKELSKENF